MQLMLEANGSYSNECSEYEQVNGIICTEQRAKLLNIAMLIPSMQLLSPFLGLFVDKFGPKLTAYFQESLGIIGLLIIIAAAKTPTDPLLYVGFAAMSISTWLGSQLIVQTGLYFKGFTISRVIFILNTFFDAGKITFLILWWIFKALPESNNRVPIVLGGYLVFAVLVYGSSAFIWTIAKKEQSDEELSVFIETLSFVSAEALNMSRHSASPRAFQISQRFTVPNEVIMHSLEGSRHAGSDFLRHSRRKSSNSLFLEGVVDTAGTVDATEISIEKKCMEGGEKKNGEVDNSKHAMSYIKVADRKPKDQLLSTPFLAHCFFFGLHVGMCNWNTATQKDFLAGLGDGDETDHLYLSIFTLLAPVSILGSPLIDKIILKFGWTVALQSINLLAITYMSIKVSSENLNIQVIGFVVFSFYRSFLFGISFSFVPVLMGQAVIGRAAGVMSGCAGLTSCLMIPLVRLALKSNAGFFVPNVALLSLCLPTTLVVCLVGRYLKLEIASNEAADKDIPV